MRQPDIDQDLSIPKGLKSSTIMEHDKARPRPLHGPRRNNLRRVGVQAFEAIELFDYVEDVPLWIKDSDGHYQWVNLPFLLNYGWTMRRY